MRSITRRAVVAVLTLMATGCAAHSQEALDLNSELPRLVNGWLGRAVATGHSNGELAALIKVLRQRAQSSAGAVHTEGTGGWAS